MRCTGSISRPGPDVRVWIDQDLCTGDGLCTDHCPEIFVLLEDGISYVQEGGRPSVDPGGYAGAVPVATRNQQAVVAAALDCPGECIFVETEPAVVVATQDDDPRETS